MFLHRLRSIAALTYTPAQCACTLQSYIQNVKAQRMDVKAMYYTFPILLRNLKVPEYLPCSGTFPLKTDT
jgi:hypothetical protein